MFPVSRRPLLLLGLALAAGLIAYGLTRVAMRPPAAAEAETPAAQLDWLAREFALSDSARAEAARIQAAYEPICDAHCSAIARAQTALRASSSDSATRAAAETELARLKQVCAESTREHLRAIAALMSPEQAKRFLALMEPRVARRDDHDGAPGLAPADVR